MGTKYKAIRFDSDGDLSDQRLKWVGEDEGCRLKKRAVI